MASAVIGHVLRPVRASASRLLATPTGTNSTVDYQQSPQFAPNDCTGFVAVQSPNATFAPPPGHFSDSWNGAANLPVIWPMHSVFNGGGCQEDEGAVTRGEVVPVGPQIQLEHPSQPSNGSYMGSPPAGTFVASTPQLSNESVMGNQGQAAMGNMIYMQPMQPVFWPMFRPTFECMQMVQVAPCHTNMTDAVVISPENMDGGTQQFGPGVVASRGQPSVDMAPARTLSNMPSEPTQNTRQAAPAGSASGARRQRRSKRGGAAEVRKTPEAALGADEVAELRQAVKSTQEACLKNRGSSERWADVALEVDVLSDRPQVKVSWADALDAEYEEFAAEHMKQLPVLLPQHNQQSVVHSAGDSNMQKGAIALEQIPTVRKAVQVPQMTILPDVDLMDESGTVEAAADPVLQELENADSANFRPTVDWVLSSAWPLTLTKRGCRIVQKAMEVGSPTDQQQIADKLHGRVHEAMKSPHANHVLQKCIEIMPPDHVQFVLTELKDEGAFAARHRFGCRILQRLIEHCPHAQTEELISEVLRDTARLCRHQYGNFVIQHILQHGSSAHRHAIAEVLCEDTIRLAKHRIASHVLSCAMVHCAAEDVQKLTEVVLHDAGQLAELSRRQYGSFVVREVNRAARLLQA